MKVEADTKRVCVLLFDGGGVVSYYHIVPIYIWREKFKIQFSLCQNLMDACTVHTRGQIIYINRQIFSIGVLMEYFHKAFALLRHWYSSNPNFHL